MQLIYPQISKTIKWNSQIKRKIKTDFKRVDFLFFFHKKKTKKLKDLEEWEAVPTCLITGVTGSRPPAVGWS